MSAPALGRAGDDDEDEESDDSQDDNPQDGEKQEGGAKKKGVKSPEAQERENLRSANYAKYEHLSNEELEKIVPRRSDGSVTSIGAMLHESGTCTGCNFVHLANGCTNGIRCKFCHAEHPKRARTRGRRNKKRAKDGAESNAENGTASKRKSDGEGNLDLKPLRDDPVLFPPIDERGNSWPSFYAEDDDTYGYMGRRASSYARLAWSYSAQSAHGARSYGGAYGPYGPPPAYAQFSSPYGQPPQYTQAPMLAQ